MILVPDGMIESPPYAEGRFTISDGNVSQDFIKIQSLTCWNESFSIGSVDWALGWKKLWLSAAKLIGTGTDFGLGRIGLEFEAYFSNGQMASKGLAVQCSLADSQWADKADQTLQDLCGPDRPIAGCVGVIVDEQDALSRPCLTIMVSGPGGSLEAAMIIREALMDCGLNAGVAIRTVRNDAAGVVKVPFLPELYLYAGHNSFGINWALWSKLASANPAIEWACAELLWCDAVIAAAINVQRESSLLIDGIYFDFMRVIPLGNNTLTTKLLEGDISVKSLINTNPHEYLFK